MSREVDLSALVGGGWRRLYLWKDDLPLDNVSVSGWNFVVEDIMPDGAVKPVFDTWHETLEEILMYPGLYAEEEIRWRDGSGMEVDLASIPPLFR
ncbi:MAG: hypothetical protein JWP50_96 [Phenylobacterium sp.]|nr:hypothetical protein [Phenylobacterium sp.]